MALKHTEPDNVLLPFPFFFFIPSSERKSLNEMKESLKFYFLRVRKAPNKHQYLPELEAFQIFVLVSGPSSSGWNFIFAQCAFLQ